MSKDDVSTSDPPSSHTNKPASTTLATATSLDSVRTALADLRTEHNAVTARLDASLAQHSDLLRQLRRLDLSRARLGTLANSARTISHGPLASAASTASRISSAVETLDLEQERVKATLDVVEQVTELKACVLGVVGSMGAPQDWETAAEYIARASRIPKDVVSSGFAEAVVPTAEVPEPPSVTLDESAEALCRLFQREFEKAVEEGDGSRITRFFKMFPLIQRAKEGLEAYGRYVCQGVALRARARLQASRGVVLQEGEVDRRGFVYANALTKLFEHIAQVVDGHTPLVERHYGEGTMGAVVQRLHNEADVQGGIVLDTWYDERGIERKLTDVKSYAFSFLVQSFMGGQKPGGPARTVSTIGNVDVEEEEIVDTKVIDQVLSEIVAMLSSWSLYVVFISTRTLPPTDDTTSPAEVTPLKPPPFLTTSALPKKVSKTLLDPFRTFSTFFLRRSIERAFQLDESPSTHLSLLLTHPITATPPFITSAVDDIMYVVNQLLTRALATSQADIVTATCSTMARVLGSDFIGMLQRKMRDESYPKPAVQGALPPEDKVLAFCVLINNLDVAVEYIARIVHTHTDTASSSQTQGGNKTRTLADLFPMARDAHAVRSALDTLESGFSGKAKELLGDGVAVLFAQVLKPRLRVLMGEVFRDREGEYAAQYVEGAKDGEQERYDEAEETKQSLRNRLQNGWEVLTRPLKRVLQPGAYDTLLTAAITFIAGTLERRIWSYQGKVGMLGAVALERDVVDVVNVVTRGERFGLREVFARCQEIVMVMNLEEEEWEAQKEEGGEEGEWTLSDEERARARGMVAVV